MKKLSIFFVLFLTSCTLPIDYEVLEKRYDTNSLKETERTYKIFNQDVRLAGDLTKTKFRGDWYIVNGDFMKTFNENQDTLLRTLERLKAKDSGMKMCLGLVGMLTVVFLTVLVLLSVRRKQNG